MNTRHVLAAACLCVAIGGNAPNVSASENISVAIISFSPYGAWYIVRDKHLARDLNLDIRIIEGIPEKNAAIASGQVQCMNNTLDTMVLARAGQLPIKVVAFSDMSYGLDKMVVTSQINSVNDFRGKSFGADYGFLNHMWMLLTLKRAGIPTKDLRHIVMLPQDSAAAFASGNLDIDVNYDPFAAQSLARKGSKVFKSSLTDRTWERGIISDAIACSDGFLSGHKEQAQELLRAWFEAVDWWKEHPEEGDAIVAKGLGWKVEDVKLTQHGAIMLNLSQNLGAFGSGGTPLCKSLPEGAPAPPNGNQGWGILFHGPDCESGYAPATWDLFSKTYFEAGVAKSEAPSSGGFNTSLLNALAQKGYTQTYSSNKWIGRLGQ